MTTLRYFMQYSTYMYVSYRFSLSYTSTLIDSFENYHNVCSDWKAGTFSKLVVKVHTSDVNKWKIDYQYVKTSIVNLSFYS